MLHVNLLHIDTFYQYLVDGLLDLIMYLFFPDPEPAIINILYEWSGIYAYFKSCSVLFSQVTSSTLLSLYLDLHTFIIFAPCGYGLILSKVCNLLSLLLLNAILLISSLYTLRASLLNLCCDFNIVLLFRKHSL